MNLKRNEDGFSLIELLIVVAIIGIIATIAVPQLLDAIDRARQRRTMADMRNIATANGTYRVDEGVYAPALSDLVPTYMQVIPANDAWVSTTASRAARTCSSRSAPTGPTARPRRARGPTPPTTSISR